jgi:hypothetical protein
MSREKNLICHRNSTKFCKIQDCYASQWSGNHSQFLQVIKNYSRWIKKNLFCLIQEYKIKILAGTKDQFKLGTVSFPNEKHQYYFILIPNL